MNSMKSAVADLQGAAFGEDLGETAGGDEHREGGHEGDDLAVGDHDAVDEAGARRRRRARRRP